MPEERQLWDFLGDHKSNKKSQYNDFSRKVPFRGINLKQLLVIKTLESVRYLPCTSPCYTVGKHPDM